MKQFLFTIAGVFVGLILFFIIIPIIMIASAAGSSKSVTPNHAVLVLDLRQEITDQSSASPFSAIAGSPSIVQIVRKLEAAETDRKVKGLVLRAPEMGLAPAHAEEIRQAVKDFRASGKWVVATAQGFEYPTLSNYVAVSAADEIWLQNPSDFSATGLMAETTFFGGLFEKFGIAAQFEQFHEYKNAANTYTQKDYTEAHREATTSLLTGVYNAFLAEIAVDRKIGVEPLKVLLDQAPLPAKAALDGKLVDRLGMPEEAMDAALEKAGGKDKATLVAFEEYMPEEAHGPTIALIGGEGAIVSGPDTPSGFGGESNITSDAMVQSIRDATDDDEVKAIVLRVSSPGGSALASEQIWAAVERAKLAKKPVVISMGAYAASGGYYIAANADKIVAMPSTITGSIGVLGGKMAINGALNRYTGANISAIELGGPYVSAFSGAQPFTNSQREQFRASMARIYESFTGKVASGRKLPIARVLEIAKGRVYTGNQARELGLVDSIGGLRSAINEAKTLAKIDTKKSVSIKSFNQEEDPIKALAAMFGANTQSVRAAAVLGALVGDEKLNQLILNARNRQTQASEAVRVH